MWAAQAALAEESGRRCRVRGDQEFNFEEMQATRSGQSGCRNVAFTARLRADGNKLGSHQHGEASAAMGVDETMAGDTGA